jgi:DNA polymerase elongation subunit (family B)
VYGSNVHTTNNLLYGQNPEKCIVAVEKASAYKIRVYKRENDQVFSYDESFHPFFFLADLSLLDGIETSYTRTALEGSHYYKYLIRFTNWSSLWRAVKYIQDVYSSQKGREVDSYKKVRPLYLITSPAMQYLISTGKTLFKGMEFNDLHRLQLDIEVYTDYEFPNPDREEDRIIIISLSDNRGWEHAIEGRRKSETKMLEELIDTIMDKDPDIIEGHNIFNFDFDYIRKRCVRHELGFPIGRDDTNPTFFSTRGKVGDAQVEYTSCHIHGRHVIDTFFMLQSFDSKKRYMEAYSLKYAADFLGFTKKDRTFIDAARIAWWWKNKPEQTIRYALDDVYDVRMLSEHVCQNTGVFYQTQMLPVSFQTISLMGDGSKVQYLMLRPYIAAQHSIPRPQAKKTYEGAIKEVFLTGLGKPVVHADVKSLYPSIMLNYGVKPSSDVLNIFPTTLRLLTEIRLKAKDDWEKAKNPQEKAKLDALHTTYKVLINSFYGYLGFSNALFNDMKQAARVTEIGRNLLSEMIGHIKNAGGTIMEADTDGIYFVPPDGYDNPDDHKRFIQDISSTMPEGIIIEYDGTYKKMLSYKKANYILQKQDNTLIIKGGSFRSRAVEKFCREFIREAITLFLNEDLDAFTELYETYKHKILNQELDVSEFSKKERLRQSLEEYQEKTADGGPRLAVYEIALKSNNRYRKGDQISYYITGDKKNIRNWEFAKPVTQWNPNHRDENIAYYLERLNKAANRFSPFTKGLNVYTTAPKPTIIIPEEEFIPAIKIPQRRTTLYSKTLHQLCIALKQELATN